MEEGISYLFFNETKKSPSICKSYEQTLIVRQDR